MTTINEANRRGGESDGVTSWRGRAPPPPPWEERPLVFPADDFFDDEGTVAISATDRDEPRERGRATNTRREDDEDEAANYDFMQA